MEIHTTYQKNYFLLSNILISKGENPEVPLKGMLFDTDTGWLFPELSSADPCVHVWLSHYSTSYFYQLSEL